MAISYPPIFVNDYLAEKAKQAFGTTATIPFFPTGPSTIEQLTQTFPDSEGLFCVYDRMFRMRRKAFPHIKDEQLLYYFYKTAGDPELLIETTQLVQDLLDRGDESGQEVNAWIQSKLTTKDDGSKVYIKGGKEFLPVFFHEFTIYQLEEARDIVDFGTARTYAGNKIIISYCYHTVGEGKKTVDGIEKRTYNDTIIS
jgi:hypothetical protein